MGLLARVKKWMYVEEKLKPAEPPPAPEGRGRGPVMFVIRLADGSYYAGTRGERVERTESVIEAVHFMNRWDAVKAAGTSREFADAMVAPYWDTSESLKPTEI